MGHSLLALENRLQAEEPSTASTTHQTTTTTTTTTTVAESLPLNASAKCAEQQDKPNNEVSTNKMIEFITDRPLGQEEQLLVLELTKKKKQSKKSTMSERHLLAKQQLARELVAERRNPLDINCIRYAALSTSLNRSYSVNLDELYERGSSASGSFQDRDSICGSKSNPKLSYTSTTTGSCGAHGSSFSESDKSYEMRSSTSHQDSAYMTSGGFDEFDQLQVDQEPETDHDKVQKAAAIRLKKSRLEQLNAELETRLYQYEYLVAQEKALLGTYNMMLFTKKGVNNFQLTQDTL